MARNYNDATLVTVGVSGFTGLQYGFRSRLKSSLRDDLGQVLISSTTSLQGLVIGVNSPKPTRATKEFATGSESSFADPTKFTTLRTAGWTLTRSKAIQQGGNTANSTVYYLTVNGIKYAFRSANTPTGLTGVPDRTAIGLKQPTENDKDLVFGASFPKPPRFKKKLDTGKTFSTWIDPSKTGSAVGQGGKAGGGNYTAAAFLNTYGIQLAAATT
jgi:hypothetical protein